MTDKLFDVEIPEDPPVKEKIPAGRTLRMTKAMLIEAREVLRTIHCGTRAQRIMIARRRFPAWAEKDKKRRKYALRCWNSAIKKLLDEKGIADAEEFVP